MLHIHKCSIIWHLSLSCLQPFPLKIDKSFTLRERQTLTSWNVICTSKTCVGFDTLMLQLQCSETFSRKLAVAGVWTKRDKGFEVSFNVNIDILLQNQYQRFDFFFQVLNIEVSETAGIVSHLKSELYRCNCLHIFCIEKYGSLWDMMKADEETKMKRKSARVNKRIIRRITLLRTAKR